MKINALWIIILVAVIPIKVQAQLWSELGPVFEQLDLQQQENFLEQLENLQDSWNFGSIQLNSIVDSLNNGLSVLDPNAPIDEMLDAWGAGSDSLSNIIGNSNLSVLDSIAIMDEYNQTNEIWVLNLDSLNNVLDQYGEGTDYPEGWLDEAVERFEVFEGLWTQTFNELQETLVHGLLDTEPQGLGNMEEFLDTLLSSMFDLELAYGQQNADITFWSDHYNTQAMEVRLGSVPRFEEPFEARWHVAASYFTASESNLEENSYLSEGINALRYSGNFSLMYNPVIGSIGENGRIRLYSSLGMEVGTYVPAHYDPAREETRERVGKTTGFGPQVGAGFVINVGDLDIYSYGTYALGSVSNSPNYDYQSVGTTAGIRYGDIVHISYQFIDSDWAGGKNKNLIANSVTVGLILTSLMN